MYFYRAFGLLIQSEWCLEELAVAQLGAGEEPDLRIVTGDAGVAIPPPDAPSVFDYKDPAGVLMMWPIVGAFRIRSLDRIELQPAPGVKPEYVAFPLLGPVMAWLLHLRGLTVLHGSAVSWNGAAFGFLGDKLAGKSTTAASFLRAGATLLTDDLLAFNMDEGQEPSVQPAFAQMKLSDETAAVVAVEGAEALPLIMEDFPKRQHRLDRFDGKEMPCNALFVLKRTAKNPTLSWLPQTEAMMQLLRFSYNVRFGNAPVEMQRRERHFKNCATLANSFRVGVLDLPSDLDRLPEAVELVQRSLKLTA